MYLENMPSERKQAKAHILYASVYMKYPNQANPKRESRLVLWGQRNKKWLLTSIEFVYGVY